MDENFNELITKFKEINNMKYVKGVNNLPNSVGLTFEKLLGKKADSLFFPDFKNIEIKTTCRFSHYPVGLFTSSFDGPEVFEANYLLQNYGVTDKKYRDKKILITPLKIDKKILINKKYYFELKIDYIDKKLYINIFDKNYNFIEKRGFIDFDTIKNKIEIKLTNLALIFASKKNIDGQFHFRYYKIICFKFKSFDDFLNAIQTNKIKISLCLRVARSGVQEGKTKNKNLIFSIDKEDIPIIYDKLYIYEN